MDFSLIEPDDPRWVAVTDRVAHDAYHASWFTELQALEKGVSGKAVYGTTGDSEFLIPLLLYPLQAELELDPELQDAASPDGYPSPLFAGDPEVLTQALLEVPVFLRSVGVITCFLRSNPHLGVKLHQFSDIGEIGDRGGTLSIVLNKPYDEILSRMRQGHRYEIKKARRNGFSFEIDDWSGLKRFVTLYDALMSRHNATPKYRFSQVYFDGMRERGKGYMYLATVKSPTGEIAAATLFSLSHGVLQYQYAVTDPSFSKHAPQKLLIDGLIRFGMEQEAQFVHLGGGVGAGVDSLFQFKDGFGGMYTPYQTIHIIADPVATAQAAMRWQAKKDVQSGDTDFFPPYRTPGESR